jgi:hypothetical protein
MRSLALVPRQHRPLNYICILGLRGLRLPGFKNELLILKQLPHLSNLLLELIFVFSDIAIPHSSFDDLYLPNVTCLSLRVCEEKLWCCSNPPIPIPVPHLISCFPSVKELSIHLDYHGQRPYVPDLSPSPPRGLVSLSSQSHLHQSLLIWLINQNPHLRHLSVHYYHNDFITALATHCGNTLESLSLLWNLREDEFVPLSNFTALRNLSTGYTSERINLEEIKSGQLRRFEIFLWPGKNLSVSLSRILVFLGRCPVLVAMTCCHRSKMEPLAEIDAWAEQHGVIFNWLSSFDQHGRWDHKVSRIICIIYIILMGLSFTVR